MQIRTRILMVALLALGVVAWWRGAAGKAKHTKQSDIGELKTALDHYYHPDDGSGSATARDGRLYSAAAS
jgi:hypothetical protein